MTSSDSTFLVRPPARLVIASRASRLAIWQSEHVRRWLQKHYPDCAVRIEAMTTRGDQILDRSLSKLGGKGLFIKELERALLEGRCDLAVHSLKDVPMALEPEFTLAAVLAREDARDAFISTRYASLADLPDGAVLGTSSLRREAQIRARYPRIRIEPLRGNLDSRLAKLDGGGFDAIILAAAGLTRLGLGDRVRTLLDPSECLPAPGQGALGIEICVDRPELVPLLAGLHDVQSAACVRAERAVSRGLGGNCSVPLAAYATYGPDHQLSLAALVARADGTALVRAQRSGPAERPEDLGQAVALELEGDGALALLR